MKKELMALIILVVGIIVYYAMVIYDIFKKRKYNLMVRDERGVYRRIVKKER